MAEGSFIKPTVNSKASSMVLLEPPTPCGRVEKKRIPPKKKFHQEPDHKGGIVNYLKEEIICDQVAQVR